MAVEAGVAKKSGAWYTYGDQRLGQGREAAKQTLRENPELRDELETKVREAFGIPVITRSEEEADKVTPVAKPKKR
jgi:recombination protein RecA